MPLRIGTKQGWEKHEWNFHVVHQEYYCRQDGCLDSPAFSLVQNLHDHQQSTHPHRCDRRCSKFCQYVSSEGTKHLQPGYSCVFCGKRLQSAEGLGQTWADRQDHIAAHFKSGERMNSRDYSRAVPEQPSTKLSSQGSLDSEWNFNDPTLSLPAIVPLPQQYPQSVPSSSTGPFVNPNELHSPYSSFFNSSLNYDSSNQSFYGMPQGRTYGGASYSSM